MPWPHASSGHHQPRYWLCRISLSLCSRKKDLNHSHYVYVNKWQEMQLYFAFPQNNSARQVLNFLWARRNTRQNYESYLYTTRSYFIRLRALCISMITHISIDHPYIHDIGGLTRIRRCVISRQLSMSHLVGHPGGFYNDMVVYVSE